ncbi:hypothetical protein HZ326_1569 [Fusarium oxysporum f. sp. albedinis]|nr:hypothetical protein HZ326_1569 [Fusarium oxysporum f. sp. albedinis]
MARHRHHIGYRWALRFAWCELGRSSVHPHSQDLREIHTLENAATDHWACTELLLKTPVNGETSDDMGPCHGYSSLSLSLSRPGPPNRCVKPHRTDLNSWKDLFEPPADGRCST